MSITVRFSVDMDAREAHADGVDYNTTPQVWEGTSPALLRKDWDYVEGMIAAGEIVPLVLKLPTRKYWAGRGQQGTAATEFLVCSVRRIDIMGMRPPSLTVHVLTTIPLRQKK